MLSRIVDGVRGVKSYLLLEHKIPVYMERSEYLRQRAILESVKDGGLIDLDKGVDLIDVTETTAILLHNGKQIEFARNKDGIYFARIEGGKYYPIDTEPSEDLLKGSREYEDLSKSFWRRFLKEPYERIFGPATFGLQTVSYGLSDITFQLHLTIKTQERIYSMLETAIKNQQEIAETLEQKVRGLFDTASELNNDIN